ncbi:DUF4838 domain-containing protein, partial [bacterium]|nr:DUF4838 domain-containing protein [bacterium]
KTQFCVSQADLVAFLAEGLRDKLMHEWYDADIVNIWGFDTWGQNCQCPKCQKLGNSTDQMLYFLSHLRGYLNQSQVAGTLDHAVLLAGCAYEGTATMEGPAKDIPDNLVEAGDWVTFYPINRCYAHNLAEAECNKNCYYMNCLKEWFARKNQIKLMLGEYYNVSKFEDLPALFINRQWRDMPTYFQNGASAATYMHLPMVNWGMRRITQFLHAEMSWNPQLDVLACLTKYWADNYGPYAVKMQRIYRDVEAGFMFISQWRAWDHQSILTQLLHWDGKPSPTTLDPGDHFISVQELYDDGWESVRLLRAALSELEHLRLQERLRVAESHAGQIINAANPLEAERQKLGQPFLKRLDEAWRSLIYGVDTMELFTLMLGYHTALSQKKTDTANELWGLIEILAEEMTRYYVPIGYEHPGPGLQSDGALRRTQLDTVIDNCRRYRIQSL